MIKFPRRGGTAPATPDRGPAPRRGRRAAAALAMLALPLAVTALTAIPAAAATGPYTVTTVPASAGPDAVAVDPVTHTAYVADGDGGGDQVSVIGGPSKPVTIGVGDNPDAVGVDPTTDTVYVANNSEYAFPYAQGPGTVSVINGATNTVTATISGFNVPDGVAVDPVTHMVYVADAGGNVEVIDEATNKITATIGISNNRPDAVAVDPSTGTVYTANHFYSTVSVITPTTKNGVTTYPVTTIKNVDTGQFASEEPHGVAVDPSTHMVYVTNASDDTMSVVNEATNDVDWTVGLGTSPLAVGVDSSTHAVYVANYDNNNVWVMSGATGPYGSPPAVIATLGTGDSPDGVGVDPSTDTAYVANELGYSVSVIGYNPPTSYPSGYHQLVAENSNLCVGLLSVYMNDNLPITQDTCGNVEYAQGWQWNPVSGGYGELQNQNSGKDLVVANASTANGAKIIQYDQNGTTNGLWKPIALGSGVWQFQNENSGQCLDVTGASTSPGVQLDQWPCQSNPFVAFNQVFVTR